MIRLAHWIGTLAVPLLVAFAFFVPSGQAHEARPAYLEIKETAPGQFSVLFRTPMLAGMRLPLVLKLPDAVTDLKKPVIQELFGFPCRAAMDRCRAKRARRRAR